MGKVLQPAGGHASVCEDSKGTMPDLAAQIQEVQDQLAGVQVDASSRAGTSGKISSKTTELKMAKSEKLKSKERISVGGIHGYDPDELASMAIGQQPIKY